MSGAIRVSASQIKASVEDGSTLLVCAYDDDSKFEKFHLEGAIALSEFKTKANDLDKATSLVFYCAWPNEGSAAGLADKYSKEGFEAAFALKDGPKGWQEAGYGLI